MRHLPFWATLATRTERTERIIALFVSRRTNIHLDERNKRTRPLFVCSVGSVTALIHAQLHRGRRSENKNKKTLKKKKKPIQPASSQESYELSARHAWLLGRACLWTALRQKLLISHTSLAGCSSKPCSSHQLA